jgi:hypothetical protein
MVPGAGLEPARYFYQRILSALRTNNVNKPQLTTAIKIATYEYLAIGNYCELLLFDAVCCALP